MPTFSIEYIQQVTNGKTLSSPNLEVDGFTTDSRDKNIKGKLFLALVGELHDAHKFVSSAVENGAAAVLIHKWENDWENLKAKASFILVNDTLKALQGWATDWRKKSSAKVIGLTGSNGKTTTKDFLSQILSQGAPTVASHGSFNNHWGVPFTLLKLDSGHHYCVAEMGMNHPGELTVLSQIAQPDIVTVLNVGKAHMGHFKNVEEIAKAKAEIYDAAPQGSEFVFNIDNPWTQKMFLKNQTHVSYTYSIKNFSADVYFRIKKHLPQGFEIEGQIRGVLGSTQVKFWGEQNLENLAAAACLASVAGMNPEQIWKALPLTHTGWGRNQWIKSETGATILFDGYNANPDSFQSLLLNLQKCFPDYSKKVGIFGEMLELGNQTDEEHKKLGEKAGALSWDEMIFIGPSGSSFLAGWKSSGNMKNPIILNSYKESLDIDLLSMVNEETFTVIKGSRGGGLERIVERLRPQNFTQK